MFGKIFNRNSLKQITSIEDKWDITYPNELKEIIKSNGKDYVFNLPDEPYKLLDSLTDSEVHSDLEDASHLIKHLNSGKNSAAFKKIPFARNQQAGKDKYLVFEDHTSKIYLTDNNAIINQLEITKLVNLNNSNRFLGIAEMKNVNLPKGISYWKDSYGLSKIQRNSAKNDLIVESFGCYYKSSKREESIAKIEMQCSIIENDIQFNLSSSYQIDNPEIDRPLKYMLDYRLYYYNLWCLIDCLNLFMEDPKITQNTKSIISEFNLFEKARNILKGQSVSKI